MDTPTVFSDSNEISGSSSVSCVCVSNTESISPLTIAPDVLALRRLSHNLKSILDSSSAAHESFSDATIVVSGGRDIGVHRCILSARSPFFRSVFSGKESGFRLELKELTKDIDLSFDALVNVLEYLYTGMVKRLPDGVCVCADEECPHVGCRPAVDFVLEVLYASFTFQISELVSLYQRHLLDILDQIVVDDLLAVLSVANVCGKACERLFTRCIDMIVRSDVDVITLDKTLPHDIVNQIVDSRLELGVHRPEFSSFPDKHVKRIHRALDSDDVELLRMLLREAHTTLDDACALHYAVAYCDAKTTTELLNLSLADVNLRNARGYTVMHIAAMRKEPKIVVSLLTKGALPSCLTPDGRKALQISKRLTRAADYKKPKEEGKESSKDCLCVEILEQAEGRAPLLGEASFSLAMAGDDVRMQLLYYENRVTLARLMFPREAKVAMEIAQVDGTSEFILADARAAVDLNDAPFRIGKEHLDRLRALSKTVELGKRFFPRCSKVLDKIMDVEELTELAHLENQANEEQQMKMQRYMELQEVVGKAFIEDKEEYDRSQNISSSSSSTFIGIGRPNGRLTFRK